jgi:pimeloyl-ACP methyl ester carboxylesterase
MKLRQALRLLLWTVLTPLALLLGCQSNLIYHPRAYRAGEVESFTAWGGHRIDFISRLGAQTAFFVPPRAAKSPRMIWVAFGGNAALALDWRPFVEKANHHDGFLLVDYPGYGLCAGRPNPGRIREQARLAVEALRAESPMYTDVPLAVLGHSLGCAAALMLAEDLQMNRVLLISPFTSLVEMGNHAFFPPLGHLATHRFDNVRALSNLCRHQPHVVLVHGERDTIIPASMSDRLALACPDRVQVERIPDAGHNDILDAAPLIIERLSELSAKIEQPHP